MVARGAPIRFAILSGLWLIASMLPGARTAASSGAPKEAPEEPREEAGDFALVERPGKFLEVRIGEKTAARYMYAHDVSSPERLHETYKPYLHVFDAEGTAPITKGPGGKFTHHRGIFIGWNRIGFEGKRYDRWHMSGGEIVHQRFLQTSVTPDSARFTSLTHWFADGDTVMIQEERTTAVRRAPEPGRLLVDFTAKLTASGGDIELDGDPEHAGVQYRPADEVVTEETIYAFPREGADPRKDLDYPWVGETYTLRGKRHSIVQLNHPQNPKGTKFSAYRDYGRFGAFFTAKIPKGDSLTVRYRFLIADGEMPSPKAIEKLCEDFSAAAAAPSGSKAAVRPASGK